MPVVFEGFNAVVEDNAGGFPTTTTTTTTRDIQAGEHVMMMIGATGSGGTPTTVTVGSLALAQDKADTGVFTLLQLWSGRATSLIASGSTVSVTMNGSQRNLSCWSFSGIAPTGYVDVTANKNGTSATPDSGTTTATSLADAVAVGCLRLGNAALTIAPGGSYTEIAGSEDPNATAGWTQEAEYLILSATGTQNATWTASGSATYEAMIVVYKAAYRAPDTFTAIPFQHVGRNL